MEKRHVDIVSFNNNQVPNLNRELRDIWDWLNHLKVEDSVPTGGNNGDIRLYFLDDESRLYFKTNDEWNYITIGSDPTPYVLDNLSDVDVGSPSDNDIIRYNSTTEHWESCSEPFDFTQVNLTPRSTYAEDVEGGMYYDSDDNHIYVGTE